MLQLEPRTVLRDAALRAALRTRRRVAREPPTPFRTRGDRASIQAPVFRRIPAPAAFNIGDERGDRSPDRFGMILLQEVDAVAELDEPAIVQLAGELFRVGRGDER